MPSRALNVARFCSYDLEVPPWFCIEWYVLALLQSNAMNAIVTALRAGLERETLLRMVDAASTALHLTEEQIRRPAGSPSMQLPAAQSAPQEAAAAPDDAMWRGPSGAASAAELGGSDTEAAGRTADGDSGAPDDEERAAEERPRGGTGRISLRIKMKQGGDASSSGVLCRTAYHSAVEHFPQPSAVECFIAARTSLKCAITTMNWHSSGEEKHRCLCAEAQGKETGARKRRLEVVDGTPEPEEEEQRHPPRKRHRLANASQSTSPAPVAAEPEAAPAGEAAGGGSHDVAMLHGNGSVEAKEDEEVASPRRACVQPDNGTAEAAEDGDDRAAGSGEHGAQSTDAAEAASNGAGLEKGADQGGAEDDFEDDEAVESSDEDNAAASQENHDHEQHPLEDGGAENSDPENATLPADDGVEEEASGDAIGVADDKGGV